MGKVKSWKTFLYSGNLLRVERRSMPVNRYKEDWMRKKGSCDSGVSSVWLQIH